MLTLYMRGVYPAVHIYHTEALDYDQDYLGQHVRFV